MLDTPQKSLTGLSLPDLEKAYTLYLQNMVALKTLDISSLKYVMGLNIYLSGLTSPVNLSSLVGSGNQSTSDPGLGLDIFNTQTKSITIGSLVPGGSASITGSPQIRIGNNFQLEEVIIYAKNMTSLEIESPSIQMSNVRHLVKDFKIGNCSVLDQVGLASIGGDLTIYNSSISEQLNLLFLESIGGSATFINNTVVADDNYTFITGTQGTIKSIGADLVIANIGANQTISLPSLETVGGMVNITGDIANLSLPALSQALHGFSVISTHADLDCSFFDALHRQLVIRDPYVCKGGSTSKPTTTPTSSTASTTSSTASETSTPNTTTSGLASSAKIGIGVGVSALVVIVIAAVGAWLVKKRKKNGFAEHVEKTPELADSEVKKSELGLGGHHEQAEMDAKAHPQELASSASLQELPSSTYYEMAGDGVEHSSPKVKG